MKTFHEIWVVDFEFEAPPGEKPKPVCLVARELNSGRTIRFWRDEIVRMKYPPYDIGENSLFIAYYSSAEFGCHLSLGWPLPANVLDIYPEFRNRTNGIHTVNRNGLLDALVYFNLDSMSAAEKECKRDLVLRGGPWTPEEQKAILDYCASDVEATTRLYERMLPYIDTERALLRGRYMKAAARIEHNGIPIDTDIWHRLVTRWENIQDRLIEIINPQYDVYEDRTFKMDRFARYLVEHNIPWPRLDSGRLNLTDDIFKDMARTYPEIAPLRELRVSLSQMRLKALAIGADGRNRCLLSAFRSITGRNQPSNTKFVFGPAVWLRGLIRPRPGHAIAYIDWEQQEFGIAAALSGDKNMMEAYASGDPYMAFAKQAGAVPPDATKKTHPNEREQFKSCVLAVQYLMGAESLARKIIQPPVVARELLKLHRKTYPDFWKWSDAALDFATLRGTLWTCFGWTIYVDSNTKERTLRNFPMQANGAEMLRLACIIATERGIRVCAPVHDALLIEAPLDEIDDAVAATQKAMDEASSIVLNGFVLRTEAHIVRYPDRYMDDRGRAMWDTIQTILQELENATCSTENTHVNTDEQVLVHR